MREATCARVMLVMLSVCGCASARPGQPAGASSPREAMRGAYEAMLRGDESTYRRFFSIDPHDKLGAAYTRTAFKAIELHQIVDKELGQRAPARPTTRNRREQLVVTDHRQSARESLEMMQQLKIDVDGDTASFANQAESRPHFRRINGRWFLTPPPAAPSVGNVQRAQTLEIERRTADAIDAGIEAVRSGKATTIAELNKIVSNRLPKVSDFDD